jgi:hypothetical protein
MMEKQQLYHMPFPSEVFLTLMEEGLVLEEVFFL